MPKETRCSTSLNGRVIQRSLNRPKNLLNICLMQLFAHSTQAILGLQWMLDCKDVPGGHDACEHLLGFRKNKSPCFCTRVVQRSHRVEWLPVCRGMVFPLFFPLAREGFLGFYIYVFLYFFLLRERVFWVLFFMS